MGQCYEKGIRIYMENMGNKYFALNLLQEEPGALLEVLLMSMMMATGMV